MNGQRTALITGAAGLIGTEACLQYADAGYQIIGIDNDMRKRFFGEEASTAANYKRLYEQLGGAESTHRLYTSTDIRNYGSILRIFDACRPDVIIHTAAQPSHDWAAREPHIDFEVNAVATLNLLQAARLVTPQAPFIHCSTSKVYGSRPNELPLRMDGNGLRLDLSEEHEYFNGITTTMSVDLTTHSLFGVSKLAGDLLAQEYGRYFEMPTAIFRPGCLTGGFHAGTELHGFLSYLMRCAISRRPYTVYGYDGLQVRCNIHSSDLVAAFKAFTDSPSGCGVVYNIGGGRERACSMREAITICEDITGEPLDWGYDATARIGDHRWWISSNAAFEADYPDWHQQWPNCRAILQEIHDTNEARWRLERG